MNLAVLITTLMAAVHPTHWTDEVVDEALWILGIEGHASLPDPCPMSDIVREMKRHGVHAVPVACDAESLPRGSIVVISGPPLGPRYAVVVGKGKGFLTLYDPARGIVKVSLTRFGSEYLGVAVVPKCPPNATPLPDGIVDSLAAW